MAIILRSANGWLWLTAPIALLLAIAAGGGVFMDGLYHDSPNLVVQARGQDLITLLAAAGVTAVGGYALFEYAPWLDYDQQANQIAVHRR